MAFDEKLAARIREALGKKKGLVEKKMFGGIAFLLNGNMCVGVHRRLSWPALTLRKRTRC